MNPEFPETATRLYHGATGRSPLDQVVDPVVPELAGPHPVEDYLAYALAQNPQVQAAKHRLEAAAARVPQESSLEDPMLEFMTWPDPEHGPQFASGYMPAEFNVRQQFPWFGELRLRAQMAEEEVNRARAELRAAELDVVTQVRRAYYELYAVQESMRVTQESRDLLADLSGIVEDRFELQLVPSQDVLRTQVEVAGVDAELVRLEQQLRSGQARLARLLHVSPSTPMLAETELDTAPLPAEIDRLYAIAVQARPELHARVFELARERLGVELARTNYYPDVSVGFNWGIMTTSSAMAPTADGLDNLGFGLMLNLPVYRNRLDAGLREAESRTVAAAREYDAMRDEALEEVADLFAQAQSQSELVRLFQEEIIPNAQQTLDVSIESYGAGDIDVLQLIDNWRQLLEFRVNYYGLEGQLRQTLASLERAVGGVLPAEPAPEPVPSSPGPSGT